MNQALLSALYTLLRPLVRLLFRRGVAVGEISDLVKRVYVDVVGEELTKAGEKATTARVAVATGLTRKDVAQIRKQTQVDPAPGRHFSRGVRVISGWLTDPEFRTDDGDPAELPLVGSTGSFQALVARHSGDMPARAVLDELLRIGVVERTAGQTVRLLTGAYLTAGGDEEGLALLGNDVALLISTIDHNLHADAEDRRYQRKVSYDNLPVEVIPEFKALAARESQKLLLQLNEWLARHDRDHQPDVSGTGRVMAGVGIYYFENRCDETHNTKEVGHED